MNQNTPEFQIIYGKYEGLEKKAAEIIAEAVAPYLPYSLTASPADTVTEQHLADIQPIFVGTAASNPYIATLLRREFLQPAPGPEGYSIRVLPNPFCPKNQAIIIMGFDDHGTLYGALDFQAYYLPEAENNHLHTTYFDPIFTEKPLPDYASISVPEIKFRGLWSWGHMIYDYKKYLEHMMRLKMNTMIIWNDFVPVNIREIIDYAHSCGIRIIAGYAWGWETAVSDHMDISNPEFLMQLQEHICQEFEKNYQSLNLDGIYFQSFTETSQETRNGVSIAETVVPFVNAVSRRLSAYCKNMPLYFGLHATSVFDKLEIIKQIDPEICIVWEDCGAFPYAYLPSQTADYEKTLAFTDQITILRGKSEKFGAVLKGLTCLDWDHFRHQGGPYIMGHSAEAFIRQRAIEKEQIWRFTTAFWLENLCLAKETIQRIFQNTKGHTMITALLEDGLLEAYIPFPAALMGELLWNSSQPTSILLRRIALRKDIRFS